MGLYDIEAVGEPPQANGQVAAQKSADIGVRMAVPGNRDRSHDLHCESFRAQAINFAFDRADMALECLPLIRAEAFIEGRPLLFKRRQILPHLPGRQ